MRRFGHTVNIDHARLDGDIKEPHRVFVGRRVHVNPNNATARLPTMWNRKAFTPRAAEMLRYHGQFWVQH